MSKHYRRYEMLVPQRFNDGQLVPVELHVQTLNDLRDHFGAISIESQIIRGEWSQGGIVYHDDMTRIFVDVPDTAAHRKFFARFKRVLMKRYQQLDIWMTEHSIRVV